MSRAPLHVLCLVLIELLTLSSARAADATSPCDAMLGLESLSADDRTFLIGVCQLEEDDASLWRTSEVDEVRRLERLVRRVVETNRGEAATLASLLPQGVFRSFRAKVACSQKVYDKQIELALAGSRKDEDREDDPKRRTTGTLSLHQACGRSVTELEDTSTSDSSTWDSTVGGLRPWSVIAPKGMTVQLLVGGKKGGLFVLQEAALEKTPDPKPESGATDGPVARAPDDIAVYTAMVPFGVPFVAVVRPDDKVTRGDSLDDEERDPPFVLQGILNDEYTAYGVPQKAVCVDLRIAAEGTPRFFLDGAQLAVAREDKAFQRTVWIPVQANAKSWEHTLLVLTESDAGPVVSVNRTLSPNPSNPDACVEAHFDLTREIFTNTIGLLSIDAGGCNEAGIDDHKLRAAIQGFVAQSGWSLADVEAWSEDNENVARLGESSGRLRESAGRGRHKPKAGFGSDRGRMDVVDLLASGGEELRRQGFSRVLSAGLSCTRRADSNWDYSFEARVVDLKLLADRQRDPLTGVNLEGVVTDEIELILDRRDLRLGVETTLGRLFDRPSMGLKAMPANQNFVDRLQGQVVAHIPSGSEGNYFVELAYQSLDDHDAVTACAIVEQTNELRTKRPAIELSQSGKWISGLPVAVEPAEAERTLPVSVQQRSAKDLLVRARLFRTAAGKNSPRGVQPAGKKEVLAESFRCTDMSRPSAELWTSIGGWFNTGPQDPARNESNRSLVATIGIAGLNDIPWMSLGVGLGYAYSWRAGSLLPLWDGVDDPDEDRFDTRGLTSYQIEEHAVLGVLSFRSSGSLCEVSFGNVCSKVSRLFLVEISGQVLPGIHFINTEGIPDELAAFRGPGKYEFGDVGLFLGAGVGVDMGSFRAFARYSLGVKRVGDFFRDPAVAGTQRALLSSPTVGVAWEF